MTKQQQAERAEAREHLLTWLKPGDTVYTILRHVSRSGMQRVVQLVHFENAEPSWIGFNAAMILGNRYNREREGVVIGGCGMDMGFALVYKLSHALWPTGHTCTGESCPSNDHSNGDRDYTPHAHKNGGYALRQRWL